jgi:hypothetical protein
MSELYEIEEGSEVMLAKTLLMVDGKPLGPVATLVLGQRAGKPGMTAITERNPGGTERWNVQRLRRSTLTHGLILDLVPQNAKEGA